MIYAEKRREDGGDGTHYTLRYLVWNGDLLGTYGVHFGKTGAYGASRDYHRPASEAEIAKHKAYEAFKLLPGSEQQKHWDAETEPDYCYPVDTCCYLDNKPAVCDGSGLVGVTENDQEAFAIAADMAEIEDREGN